MSTPILRDFSVVGNITILNSNLGGKATADSAVEIDADGRSLGTVQITGNWTGTLVLQGTINGTNWVQIGGTPFMNVNTRTAALSITANGIYQFDASGYLKTRVTASAAVTGTAGLTVNHTSFALNTGVVNPVSISGSTVLGAGTALVGDVAGGVRATTGGLSAPTRNLAAAATTNSTLVKGAAGRVYKITGYNAAAAVRYLKLYNKATAPAVGTDAPVVTIALAPLKDFTIDFDMIGEYFSTGIGFGLTTGPLDADTGALTAGDIVGMNVWTA